MYFDIESTERTIEESEIRIQIYKFIEILVPNVQGIQVHIAQAHGYTKDKTTGLKVWKCSFHCVVDIACTKAINKFIANQINRSLHEMVDLSVYSKSSSLRLPNCVKILPDGTIDERRVTYP